MYPHKRHGQTGYGEEVGSLLSGAIRLKLLIHHLERQMAAVPAHPKMVCHAVGLKASAVDQVALAQRAAIAEDLFLLLGFG